MIVLESVKMPETNDAFEAMSNVVLWQAYEINKSICDGNHVSKDQIDILACAVQTLIYIYYSKEEQEQTT